MTRTLGAVLLLTLALAATACGGGGDDFAAKVGERTISRSDVERTAAAIAAELEREGKAPLRPGTADFRLLERQVLELLIERSRREQEAEELGVTVTDEEVEERLVATPSGEQGEEGDDQFLADQARAQLLHEKLFERITGSITVSDAEVRKHFDENAKTLYEGRTFESLRETLQSQLRSAKRNAAWSKWLEQVEREYASKIEYGEGFELTG